MEDIVIDLEEHVVQVLLVNLQEQSMDQLRSIDIIPDLITEECIFTDIEKAYVYVKNTIEAE